MTDREVLNKSITYRERNKALFNAVASTKFHQEIASKNHTFATIELRLNCGIFHDLLGGQNLGSIISVDNTNLAQELHIFANKTFRMP